MEPGCKYHTLCLFWGNRFLKPDRIPTFKIFQQIQIHSMELALKILKLAY